MQPNWRYRLRGDPANWLLDADTNPSVAFWFLRDIVGRPEDAAAMLDLRAKILFSQPVQEIFAAQNELGYWDNSEQLAEPKHRSTLWTLALLAELGIPRASRRARAACEFALENLRLVDESLLGLLARALVYFNYGSDARLAPYGDAVVRAAERGNVFAVWALTEYVISREQSDREISVLESSNKISRPFGARNDITLEHAAEKILDALARGEFKTFGAFPSFDANDALLALCVLAPLNRLSDERAQSALETVWARQGDGARWALGASYASLTVTRSLIAQAPEKWGTLNVLRVITRT